MAKTLLEQTQDKEKSGMLSTKAQEGIKAYEAKFGAGSVQDKLSQYDTTGKQIETPTIDTPDIPEVTQPEDVSGTPIVTPTDTTSGATEVTPTEVTPKTDEVQAGDAQLQQAEELKNQEIEKLKEEKLKKVEDTKKGYALGKAKFEENKDYYTNFDEINNKYEAVIADITSSMSDTGVIDESKYQEIANKYGLTIEEVKNPNRIFDKAELTDEGKDKLGVTNFENSITESTKNFNRTIEDLNQNIDRTQESYNQQMEDAYRTVQDTISGARAGAAASGLYRSTAMESTVSKTKQDGERVIQRLRNGMNRSVGDIQTSISRITEDFNTSIADARKDFEDNYKQVNTENLLALSEASLNYTGDKLKEALDQISEEFGVKSQQVFSQYMNNINAINSAVNSNMDLADRIADKAEELELKTYNEYLANDGLLLQSARLTDLVQGVQEGTISVDSAQKLKKIMQTSIQATLGAITALDINDIDQINYLLEQGYTPEETIALMQQTYDKFSSVTEQDITKLEMAQAVSDYNASSPNIEVIGEDEKGNKIYGTWNSATQSYEPISGTTGGFSGNVMGDLRSLAGNYPNQAWAKNNNPAGITWNANFDNGVGTAALFDEAGIRYEKGTSRPASEGGNYVTFPTMEEGLAAQRIIMSQTYGDMTVGGMLQKWVGTSEGPNYAAQVAGNAGIDIGTKVSDLSDMELQSLQLAKIQKESPGLYDLLTQGYSTEDQKEFSEEIKAYADSVRNDPDFKLVNVPQEQRGQVSEYLKQNPVVLTEDSPQVQSIKSLKENAEDLYNDVDKYGEQVSGSLRAGKIRNVFAKKRSDYLNKIDFILKSNVLQNLIDAKAAGATFGALSDAELNMLRQSANVLNSAAEIDSETGRIKGFDMSEAEFKKQIKILMENYNKSYENMLGENTKESENNETTIGGKTYTW